MRLLKKRKKKTRWKTWKKSLWRQHPLDVFLDVSLSLLIRVCFFDNQGRPFYAPLQEDSKDEEEAWDAAHFLASSGSCSSSLTPVTSQSQVTNLNFHPWVALRCTFEVIKEIYPGNLLWTSPNLLRWGDKIKTKKNCKCVKRTTELL